MFYIIQNDAKDDDDDISFISENAKVDTWNVKCSHVGSPDLPG